MSKNDSTFVIFVSFGKIPGTKHKKEPQCWMMQCLHACRIFQCTNSVLSRYDAMTSGRKKTHPFAVVYTEQL